MYNPIKLFYTLGALLVFSVTSTYAAYVSSTTVSTQRDGIINQIRVQFDEPIDTDSVSARGFDISIDWGEERYVIQSITVENQFVLLLNVDLIEEEFSNRNDPTGLGSPDFYHDLQLSYDSGAGSLVNIVGEPISSFTDKQVLDGIDPAIKDVATERDRNNNGQIDFVRVKFTEQLSEEPTADDFVVEGYTIVDTEYSMGQEGPMTLFLTLQESGRLDTDARPVVRLVGEGISDISGNLLEPGEVGSSMRARDDTRPVMYRAVTSDLDGDGYPDEITVTFSEPVAAVSMAESKDENGNLIDTAESRISNFLTSDRQIPIDTNSFVVDGYSVDAVSQIDQETYLLSVEKASADNQTSVTPKIETVNIVDYRNYIPIRQVGDGLINSIVASSATLPNKEILMPRRIDFRCNDANTDVRSCPDATMRIGDIANHRAREYIEPLSEVGALEGRSGSSTNRIFYPDAGVTQAEVVAMVYRAVYNDYRPESLPGWIRENSDDLRIQNHRGADYMLRAIGKTWLDENFDSPDEIATRDFVAKHIVDALSSDNLLLSIENVDYDLYTDLDQSAHPESIARLTRVGILSGYPDGSIRPKQGVTRAEMAKIMALTMALQQS